MPHFNGTSLPPATVRLLDEMRAINYGHIESLSVRDGVPVFEPVTRIIEDVKLAADNDPRPMTWRDDYEIKPQVAKLLRRLDQMRDGVILLLEVQHGLPFRMRIERRKI